MAKAGRPVLDTVGYKAKVGLRYAKTCGSMVDNLSDGDVFPTMESAAARIQEYVDTGEVKVWGKKVAVQFIPFKGTK